VAEALSLHYGGDDTLLTPHRSSPMDGIGKELLRLGGYALFTPMSADPKYPARSLSHIVLLGSGLSLAPQLPTKPCTTTHDIARRPDELACVLMDPVSCCVACMACECAVRIAPNATGAPISGECSQEEMDAIVLPVGMAPFPSPHAHLLQPPHCTSPLETAPLP
jgi:hypothetical protein